MGTYTKWIPVFYNKSDRKISTDQMQQSYHIMKFVVSAIIQIQQRNDEREIF